MHSQNALTTIEITGYIFFEDASPVHQREGTDPQRCMNTPPVKLLKEEQASSTYFSTEDAMTISRIRLHSSNLATFTFEFFHRLNIIPGQAAVLDFTSFLGASPYRHMAPESPNLVNNDRLRTWTSVADGVGTTFSLTMRLKPGGAVTGALFNIANKLSAVRPELPADPHPLGLSATLLGTAGDFSLEPPDPHEDAKIVDTGEPEQMSVQRKVPMKLLWIAGEIGITPFLAMLIPSYFADVIEAAAHEVT
ncbi:hypothetical protein CY34DRAFT_14635 [Suillus luteus UH-Slu-Lm8-n1]|uniref:Uncharacterized protein n=1 Tax=Suillus luteus UH-Slu-Lm8-n1 TaxID=930992 RepID=A0A0D0AXH0_9AGAM|nr:hypothetical protein CY34DRAFT_14635 [Suillus luteus UH-Slu-Lm8-n1]